MRLNTLKQVSDADAAFRHAVALSNEGKLADAENIYRGILKQHPRNVPTLCNLAGLLWRAEGFEEAAGLLRRALNEKPNSVEARTLLAKVNQSLGRYEEALSCIEKAIGQGADSADAHDTHANLLSDLGRTEEAIHAQLRAIHLAPNQPRFYFGLGSLRKWQGDDPHLDALQALAQKPGSLSHNDQIYLQFALAKARADCGEIDEAFRHQLKGGALKRRTMNYDEAITLRAMDELCAIIDMDWIEQHRNASDSGPLPVFILGMPRSGSTLIEQILVSHPSVQTIGETALFAKSLASISGHPMPTNVTELLRQWTPSRLRRLATDYLQAIRRNAPTAERVLDKTPGNFRYAGIIHAALPDARIIHTRRDPIDTCLSTFAILFWSASQPYSYDLRELGRYYRAYENMMSHWESILPEGVMLDVQYENLVADFEGEARRIVAHCGLDWDDAVLRFDKTDRPVRTASRSQVRTQIYRDSVRRPRPSADLLRPLLEALGQTS